jgi:myb proto-oncogene protein
MLIETVKKLGKDWVAVAEMLLGRTNVQCRNRWVVSLDPDINAGKWTPAEDATLLEAKSELGKDWVAIAALVPGRTNNQCQQRWARNLDPDINTGKWTVEEDTKLTVTVKELGKDWAAVAAMVPGRTNVECRQRWANNLDPAVNRGKWTAEEDAKLTVAVKELGNDWTAVAAMVPRRTNKQCCVRWAKSSDPDIKSGNWTVEEDAKLTVAVKEFGEDWGAVAAMVPGRASIKCRYRWVKNEFRPRHQLRY